MFLTDIFDPFYIACSKIVDYAPKPDPGCYFYRQQNFIRQWMQNRSPSGTAHCILATFGPACHKVSPIL